jgi:hypothetical protein
VNGKPAPLRAAAERLVKARWEDLDEEERAETPRERLEATLVGVRDILEGGA